MPGAAFCYTRQNSAAAVRLRGRKTEQSNTEKPVGCSAVSAFPTRLAEYTNDRHGATPEEVMDALDLDESRREQVEHYLAVTRYTMFKDWEGNDADGLRWDRVVWDDVADWDVPETADDRD